MTLILVAARDGAALFEYSAEAGLRRVEDVPGPPASAALSDPSHRDEAVEQMSYAFALAERLDAGVAGGAESIILMAEARLLGAIRRHLDGATAQRIQASLNVARTDWDEAALGLRLASLLTEKRSARGSADFF